ncbi:unnamed protein product [Eruca vesicaria subsp. sativa]|uniref:Uncharacterized protein n=1 Tax=Eruca vesicaria subsp. sativa TaxID=29727 RepID=A0ABC8JQT1_ERUVS|nr:unnamed protein product [Eruca vesicaria subsp. sativa]
MGEGSNSRAWPKRIRKIEVISFEQSFVQLSSEGKKTYLVVEKVLKRPFNTFDGAYSVVFDNTCPRYKWVRNGWLVEERRIMLSGRLYRYYYDPKGKVYKTKYQVEQIFADIDKYLAKRAQRSSSSKTN